MTPGPPPVTTVQPCSPKRRPTARASSYGLLPSGTRAEPNSATAGRGTSATFSNPARSSVVIFAIDASMSFVGWSRICWSSFIALEPVLGNVRRGHAEHEHERRREVEAVDEVRLVLSAALTQEARRAPDGAPVEEPEGDHVE